jgi:hypothetical protein
MVHVQPGTRPSREDLIRVDLGTTGVRIVEITPGIRLDPMEPGLSRASDEVHQFQI